VIELLSFWTAIFRKSLAKVTRRGGKWVLAWLDRLKRRSRLAGAEVFNENVGQHPQLARG
jgi:hypothetical protein